jgi:hypothetical protein
VCKSTSYGYPLPAHTHVYVFIHMYMRMYVGYVHTFSHFLPHTHTYIQETETSGLATPLRGVGGGESGRGATPAKREG